MAKNVNDRIGPMNDKKLKKQETDFYFEINLIGFSRFENIIFEKKSIQLNVWEQNKKLSKGAQIKGLLKVISNMNHGTLTSQMKWIKC